MIALLQRVISASVVVELNTIAEIETGLLVFIGVEKQDDEAQAAHLLERILNYRLFADKNQKMNLSLKDINGELLLVPQFTLVADTQKGLRPGFSKAATPQHGEVIYNYFVNRANEQFKNVATGQFGADMKVSLVNDGPVTFLLEIKAENKS